MQHNTIEKIKKGSGMTRIHQQAGPTSTSDDSDGGVEENSSNVRRKTRRSQPGSQDSNNRED